MTKLKLLSKIESNKPFSENESWLLFRIVAISEAIGWTFLIIGVLLNKYRLPGSSIAIPIAGRIHGTVFLIYFAILIAVYSSIGWSRKKFVLAIFAGVPPYGTLIFDQWAALSRRNKLSRAHFSSVILVNVINNA